MNRGILALLFPAILMGQTHSLAEIGEIARGHAAQNLTAFKGRLFYLASYDSSAVKVHTSKIDPNNLAGEEIDVDTFDQLKNKPIRLIDCVPIVEHGEDNTFYDIKYYFLVKPTGQSYNVMFNLVVMDQRDLSPKFLSIVTRENLNPDNPNWSPRVRAAIKAQKVFIGMTPGQATASWGAPDDVNSTTTAAGTREQWVYNNGGYLYFEGGHLVAIQN